MSKDKPMSVGMDAFDTTTKSNEGIKMPLFLPDGTETDQFLVLHGVDSTAFRCAQSRSNREILSIAKKLKDKKLSDEKAAQARRENTTKLVASLVFGWSFPDPCNEKNVVSFLEKAPQVQEGVDQFAGDRSNFFVKPPQD